MKILSLVIAAVVLLAGGFIGFKKLAAKPEAQVLESARVERGDIRGVLVETGIMKSQVGAVVKIGSRITGTIEKMRVKIGDTVKKGELIALIDDRETRKSIEKQKASLESARKTLTQCELTYPQRVKEARANYAYAKICLSREEELLKHEYTTADAVDKAKSQFEATEATLKRLEDESRTQAGIYKANIEEIRAQIQQLEVNLSYARIYSPIDGIVSEVTVQEGETIVPGLQVANLVTVLDPTRLEMWIYVDETDIGRVKTGLASEYYVDTFPEKTFRGCIAKVYPQPVIKDGVVYYLATVEVSREDAALLKPEMTTHVKIIFEEKKDLLTAPNAAIKFEEGKQVAYKVIGPNKVEEAELRIGTRGEARTEIISGVKEGDELATRIVLPGSAARP